MIRRLLTATAVLGMMLVPTVTLAAPGIAHASGYSCGTTTSYQNEDAGYWEVDRNRTAGSDTVFPSDSYGTNYPVVYGPSPTGQWGNFGLWNVCWTTLGNGNGNPGSGYYGDFAIQNVATTLAAGPDESDYWEVFTNSTVQGDQTYSGYFACFNYGSMYWFTPVGYEWESGNFNGISTAYDTDTIYGTPGIFEEVNGSGHPRFNC